MTEKQEREWAAEIFSKAVKLDSTMILQAASEFLHQVKGLSEGDKWTDKPFARKIASTFENVIWFDQFHNGEITKEEYFKRLEDKGQAAVEKAYISSKKYYESKRSPHKKRRKKKN